MTCTVIEDIVRERVRQINRLTNELDTPHTANDWIAMTLAHLGRASQGVFRNKCEQCDYRESLVKAAATLLAALQYHDLSVREQRSVEERE